MIGSADRRLESRFCSVSRWAGFALICRIQRDFAPCSRHSTYTTTTYSIHCTHAPSHPSPARPPAFRLQPVIEMSTHALIPAHSAEPALPMRCACIRRRWNVQVEFTEVNLALEPSRRAEMVAISASTALPQLVVDNVFLGDADAIQELENRGALIARLT